MDYKLASSSTFYWPLWNYMYDIYSFISGRFKDWVSSQGISHGVPTSAIEIWRLISLIWYSMCPDSVCIRKWSSTYCVVKWSNDSFVSLFLELSFVIWALKSILKFETWNNENGSVIQRVVIDWVSLCEIKKIISHSNRRHHINVNEENKFGSNTSSGCISSNIMWIWNITCIICCCIGAIWWNLGELIVTAFMFDVANTIR